MYYVITNNKVYTAQKESALQFYTNIKFAECTEQEFAEGKYIREGNDIVLNPHYESEQLAKAKALKLQDINKAKEKAFKDGVYFNNVHYDCDDRAQDRTGNRLVLLQAVPVETLEWLDYQYISHTLTAAEFQQLCGSIFERIQFIEFKTGEYLNAIEQAVSIEELAAIEIDFTGETENE